MGRERESPLLADLSPARKWRLSDYTNDAQRGSRHSTDIQVLDRVLTGFFLDSSSLRLTVRVLNEALAVREALLWRAVIPHARFNLAHATAISPAVFD